MEYYSTIKRNEVLIHVVIWMILENIWLSERKDHILGDSISMNCPEQANLETESRVMAA